MGQESAMTVGTRVRQWETSRDAVPEGYVQTTVYEVGSGERVATVFGTEANVNLIAAAPALLAALEMMLENAEIDALNEDVPGIEQARAAVAAARGES